MRVMCSFIYSSTWQTVLWLRSPHCVICLPFHILFYSFSSASKEFKYCNFLCGSHPRLHWLSLIDFHIFRFHQSQANLIPERCISHGLCCTLLILRPPWFSFHTNTQNGKNNRLGTHQSGLPQDRDSAPYKPKQQPAGSTKTRNQSQSQSQKAARWGFFSFDGRHRCESLADVWRTKKRHQRSQLQAV